MITDAFHFVGRIPSSKSLINRALIIESYLNQKIVNDLTQAKDVVLLKKALDQLRDLKNLNSKQKLTATFECGEGGTTFRFLAMRLAKERGHFLLKVTPRLRSRPQSGLLKCLRQLGAQVQWREDCLEILSDGYRLMGDSIHIESDGTTQVASALLLNSWNLPFELFFRFDPAGLSAGYWTMTLKLVESYGLKVKQLAANEYHIAAHQAPEQKAFVAEPDMSSAFSVAAIAALKGSAQFLDWPEESSQPDVHFVEILQRMGTHVESFPSRLSIQSRPLKGVVLSMGQVPDLFPVLGALCSFAGGESFLFGAPQLKHKESDRMQKTFELLQLLGVPASIENGGLRIKGDPKRRFLNHYEFDPDQDHRMAMACGLFIRAGAPIDLKSKQVVEKSFPEFWKILGL